MIARICFVSGRVQGVHYRASVAQRARELALRGHARNLPDGRVEVLACGAEPDVQDFIDWLWVGSNASHVTGVEQVVAGLAAEEWPASFTTA